MIKNCVVCGKEFDCGRGRARPPNATRCSSECTRTYKRMLKRTDKYVKADRKYKRTEKYKAWARSYQKCDKFISYQKKYVESDARRSSLAKYNRSEKGQIARSKYRNSANYRRIDNDRQRMKYRKAAEERFDLNFAIASIELLSKGASCTQR